MSKLHIENIYGKLFIEADGSYTTEHKVPYLTFPDGDIDHFYVEATDFFNEMLGIKIKDVTIDDSGKHTYAVVRFKRDSTAIATLIKFPYDIISEEVLGDVYVKIRI